MQSWLRKIYINLVIIYSIKIVDSVIYLLFNFFIDVYPTSSWPSSVNLSFILYFFSNAYLAILLALLVQVLELNNVLHVLVLYPLILLDSV